MLHQNPPGRSGVRVLVLSIGCAVISALTIALFPATSAVAREAFSDTYDAPSPSYTQFQPQLFDPLAGRVAPSSRGGSRSSNPDISTPDNFIAVVGEAARDSQASTGVPASVTIAQAILESDWGKSGLAAKAFNLFGIKASRGPGPAGVVKINTWEVVSGANITVSDAFRAYHNLFESVEDHGWFLRGNQRYAKAFLTSDAKEFARRIHAAGYATDPAYSSKLIRLMDKYDLYQYDLPVP